MTRHNKICRICGTGFTARRSDAKYCSDACKTAAYEIRKKNGLQGTSTSKPQRLKYEQKVRNPNPAYFEVQADFEKAKRKVAEIEQRRYELQRKMARIYTNDESIEAALIAAGIGGASELTKKKNKRELASALARAVIGGAAGYVLHKYGYESLDSTQQRKINRAESIRQQLQELEGEMAAATMEKAIYEEELSRTPRHVMEIVEKEFIDEPYDHQKGGKQLKQGETPVKPEKAEKRPEMAYNLEQLALASKPQQAKYETPAEILNKSSQTYPFEGKWREIIGEPEHGFHVMLWGAPGLGKSTTALEFAKYLGDNFTPGNSSVLYISSEESNETRGAGATMRDKMERTGITDETRIQIGSFTDFNELAQRAKNYPFVVLDSVSDMNLTPEELKALKQNSSIVAVHQSTKAKEPAFRGNNRFLHDADTEIVLIDLKQAEVRKNRFKGNTGGKYTL